MPCEYRNSPGFDPSILWHGDCCEAADEAVLFKVYKFVASRNIFDYVHTDQYKTLYRFLDPLKSAALQCKMHMYMCIVHLCTSKISYVKAIFVTCYSEL